MNLSDYQLYSDQLLPRVGLPLQCQRELTIYLLTVGGEARGEPLEGIQAVANVILNRWLQQKGYFGTTIADVCIKESDGIYQFSTWIPNNPNMKWMRNPNPYDWQKLFEPCMKEYTGLAQFFAERNVCYYKRIDVEDYGFWNRLNHVERVGDHDFYSDPNLPSFIT